MRNPLNFAQSSSQVPAMAATFAQGCRTKLRSAVCGLLGLCAIVLFCAQPANAQASFRGIGFLPGNPANCSPLSYATGINRDGTYIAGAGTTTLVGGACATEGLIGQLSPNSVSLSGSGFLNPNCITDCFSQTQDVSNTPLPVGLSTNSNGFTEAFAGNSGLGFMAGINNNQFSDARGVTPDGGITVGRGLDAGIMRAFSSAGGSDCGPHICALTSLTSQPSVGGAWRPVTGAFGTIIVGFSLDSSGRTQAVRWVNGIPSGLGFVVTTGSSYSEATGVSLDGSVVVGWSWDGTSATADIFRWSNGQMVSIGQIQGPSAGFSYQFFVSTNGNGSVIVGACFTTAVGVSADGTTVGSGAAASSGPPSTASGQAPASETQDGPALPASVFPCRSAFRWTSATGMQPVKTLLTSAGVDTTGWQLQYANGVSSDGSKISGWGVDPNVKTQGWVAQLPGAGTGIAHDFNADLKSDILWRANTGDIAMWFMNGTTLQSGAGVGAIDPNWQIVKTPTGTGDFNGDGKADILWHHTNGSVALWLMNGATISSAAGLGAIDTSWQIAGVGDFDGDGKADILWRNTSGALAIWFMNGTTITSSAGVASLTAAWQVAGIADFNGDGKADIVLRNTSSGDVAVWLMSGATIASGAGLGVLPAAWQIVGTGDFDGDGKADILWRHSTGSLAMWFMNGTTIASSAGVGGVDPAWNVASTGDYDGNGKADILWRSSAGDVAMWLMNGATIASGAGLGVLPAAWSIVE